MKQDLLKKSLLSAVFLLLALTTSRAGLTDYVNVYPGTLNPVKQTILRDGNNDYVYEKYIIQFKSSSYSSDKTYPINAIGNIKKWPPSGGPTRQIVVDNVGGNLSFLETYFNASGEAIAWFRKEPTCDTVKFYWPGSDSTYETGNFSVDESANYIQSYPNPANDIINIHYVVKSEGNIKIDFLNSQGTVLKNVVGEYYSGLGDFFALFNVSGYTNGTYRLVYYTGSTYYSISVVISR